MAHSLVRQHPYRAVMTFLWRHAADEVGIIVHDKARQDGDAEARSNRGEQARRRSMMDRNAVLEAAVVKPALIGAPNIAATAADDRMMLQFVNMKWHAMADGIVGAAVERPIVRAQAPSHDAAGLRRCGAPKRNVGLAAAKVTDIAVGIELDHNLRMKVVQVPQDRAQQRVGEDIFCRKAHGTAEVTGIA